MRHSERPQSALGKAIRQLREKRGYTQTDLAAKAGVADPTLSMIERGHSNPTWATVRDIADALGVSMGQLAKLADKLAADQK
jgi:transcriptional regulator with XRE-family HTH domain